MTSPSWLSGGYPPTESPVNGKRANLGGGAKNEADYWRAVGSTRYLDIRRPDRGIEIGWTWLGTAYQRTALNTESKLLLLTHAFEGLGAVRVQLKQEERPSHGQGDGACADKARVG